LKDATPKTLQNTIGTALRRDLAWAFWKCGRLHIDDGALDLLEAGKCLVHGLLIGGLR
jgi:hypothetical protein